MSDWIKPGAQVVIWRDRHGGRAILGATTVKRVATRSFTVDDFNNHNTDEWRFSLDTWSTKDFGSTWHRYRLVASHPEDPFLDVLREKERKTHLGRVALVAAEDWVKDRTRENRLAAIAALQAVED